VLPVIQLAEELEVELEAVLVLHPMLAAELEVAQIVKRRVAIIFRLHGRLRSVELVVVDADTLWDPRKDC
jgi:hypothetical protein